MDKVKLILDTSLIYDLIGFGEKSIMKPYINYDEIRKEPLFIPTYAVFEFLNNQRFCQDFSSNYKKVKALGKIIDSLDLDETIKDEEILCLEELQEKERERVKTELIKRISKLYVHYLTSIFAAFLAEEADLLSRADVQRGKNKYKYDISMMCKGLVEKRESLIADFLLQKIGEGNTDKKEIYDLAYSCLEQDMIISYFCLATFTSAQTSQSALCSDFLQAVQKQLNNFPPGSKATPNGDDNFFKILFDSVVAQLYSFLREMDCSITLEKCQTMEFHRLSRRLAYVGDPGIIASYLNDWLQTVVGLNNMPQKYTSIRNDIIDMAIAMMQAPAKYPGHSLPLSSDKGFLRRVVPYDHNYTRFVNTALLDTKWHPSADTL